MATTKGKYVDPVDAFLHMLIRNNGSKTEISKAAKMLIDHKEKYYGDSHTYLTTNPNNKPIKKQQVYNIVVNTYEDGSHSMLRQAKGWNVYDLMGMLELIKASLVQQFNDQMGPVVEMERQFIDEKDTTNGTQQTNKNS